MKAISPPWGAAALTIRNMTTPDTVKYQREQRVLSLIYANGQEYRLSAELLRVYSPSAEVRGHGEGPAKLVAGKQQVGIAALEPVGNYGVKIRFDDGHQTGIYSWAYLEELGQRQDSLWQAYLDAMGAQGLKR